MKARNEKKNKLLCKCCGERKALFRYRGKVKRDDHHDLCFRCFRAQFNRMRVLETSPLSVYS